MKTDKTEKVLKLIAINPMIFRQSQTKNIRIGFISKQTSLFYLTKPNEIVLITFWDNRQGNKK